MSSSGFHEIEAPFNAFDARFDPIQSPVNASRVFLKIGNSDLDLVKIVFDAINAGFHSAHTVLNLPKHRHNQISDFAHNPLQNTERT